MDWWNCLGIFQIILLKYQQNSCFTFFKSNVPPSWSWRVTLKRSPPHTPANSHGLSHCWLAHTVDLTRLTLGAIPFNLDPAVIASFPPPGEQEQCDQDHVPNACFPLGSCRCMTSTMAEWLAVPVKCHPKAVTHWNQGKINLFFYPFPFFL